VQSLDDWPCTTFDQKGVTIDVFMSTNGCMCIGCQIRNQPDQLCVNLHPRRPEVETRDYQNQTNVLNTPFLQPQKSKARSLKHSLRVTYWHACSCRFTLTERDSSNDFPVASFASASVNFSGLVYFKSVCFILFGLICR
jgi:hypothetical protein